jgi:hypothetical protein
VKPKIPREKIIKVFKINIFITSGMIDLFIAPFEGKLHNVFINLTQILTNNPMRVDLNARLFCYFPQVGLNFSKWTKHSYVNGKLL